MSGFLSRLSRVPAVDVWLVKLTDDGPLGLRAARALLGPRPSDDRRAIDDQQRSIVARAALARLVALRSGTDAAAVTLTHDERGRPLLDRSALHVSIAHSGDYVVCAVSKRRVGVDVERFDRPEADDALAARVCTPIERQELAQLDPAGRKHALIRLWTRKEAVAKALGLGAALPFEELDVSTNTPRIPGVRPRSLRVRDLLGTPAGYAVAVATEGRWRRVRARLIDADATSPLQVAPESTGPTQPLQPASR